MARLSAGDKVPTFTLSLADGAKVSSKSLSGERYVIYFYPADDTPGCTKEACQFTELDRAFRRAKVRVIGVSPDDGESHSRFREKYGLKVELASDPGHEVMERFGAYGEKKLYGKTVVGVIRSTFVIGPTGRIEHAFYGVRADGHAARVLAAIEV
jgi:peroxiredoxin Q/BCP